MPVTCLFAFQHIVTVDRTYARNEKAASRRPFEIYALSSGVELRGFEPRTSCMPWGMLTFNTVNW